MGNAPAALLALVVCATTLASVARAQDISGTARVHDGDDIILATPVGEQQVRLLGIDAFELRQTCRLGGREWWCGLAAKAELERLVAGKFVVCSRTQSRPPRNPLPTTRVRRLCKVDGADIEEQLVIAGLAVARWPEYVPAQDRAKAAGAGAWAGCFVDPYWWRKYVRVRRLGNGC